MAIDIKTQYINVPGGYVGLQVLGDNDSTIPILFLHGGPGGNFDSFTPMAEMLAEHCKVYMYNQLGSDENNDVGDESLWVPERYIETLDTIISEIKVEKLHLIGHSWGAMLAAEHVLRNPGSPVKSITMVSPYLSTEIWIRDAKSRLAEMGEDYLRIVEESEKEMLFGGKLYQDIIEEYNSQFQCRELQKHKRQFRQYAMKPKTVTGTRVYRHMWGPSEFTCVGILKDMDITPRLPQIKVRVLIICGVYDQVRKETIEYYRSLIPGSVRVTIPEASQTSFLENPDSFYDSLTAFLQRFI
ncbi:MAG: proline iminopeptidase-family hydrolase [Synergistaceae bacterium]|nr:proline iminopeptidase-family hydrolase [Synergistaceae bacterium]